MLNNLEFCCDTHRQNGAVDQDSLFCIFSGGRSCYYFCNCAAFIGSLAMASISQKKCFLIHHVFHTSRKRFAFQIVSFTNSSGGRYHEKNVPASKQKISQTNKHNFFTNQNLFFAVQPSITV